LALQSGSYGATRYPDPERREDALRSCGVLFELFAKLPHVDAEVLRLVFVGGPPDLAKQLTVRCHTPRLAEENVKELELDRSELDLLPAARKER